MVIVSMLKRYWDNHWKPIADTMTIWMMGCIAIFVILCFILLGMAIAQDSDHQEIDNEAPAPPQGVRVVQPVTAGTIEQEYKDYAPTGNLRMEDGQGNKTEYNINIDNPSEGGSVEGDYYGR